MKAKELLAQIEAACITKRNHLEEMQSVLEKIESQVNAIEKHVASNRTVQNRP